MLTVETQTARAIRTMSTVHFYDGPDVADVLNELMHRRFTGPIKLNIRTGQLISIEWQEKIRESVV